MESIKEFDEFLISVAILSNDLKKIRFGMLSDEIPVTNDSIDYSLRFLFDWNELPDNIWTISTNKFAFYGMKHPEIMDWLMNHCMWLYSCYTINANVEEGCKTVLKFESVQGSVEFKLRFA